MPKPQRQDIYYQSWDDGEIKDCTTYSDQPHLLTCDDTKVDWKESFLNLILDNVGAGMTHDEAYRRAFETALARSKEFLVSFSDYPWPDPKAPEKQTLWKCSRDSKGLTCNLHGTEDPLLEKQK